MEISISWLRNLFHDSIVQGCDASPLLESVNGIKSEKASGRSFGMRNFKYVNTTKKRPLRTNALPHSFLC
ncbi:peroxidase 29-like [Pyrus ussuriensis x Pyrus communis]|uniref:Peroxidase 29-like n=1 Tax=Pyrus ussuriensis x Pyrus communis TaxID=2448454 RepID=A0A5N5HSH8_9ROSA|nr:peroxidase 29-like [Pyrus ussuriensis x Pyrus communis]